MIRRMLSRLTLGLALVSLLPAMVEACASCISSAYGDRTYNWPYLVLILVPFAVAVVIGVVLVRVTGVGVSDFRRWFRQIFHPDVRQEETP